MTWTSAIKYIRKGHKIRRACWANDHYIYKDKASFIMSEKRAAWIKELVNENIMNEVGCALFALSDTVEKDWEIAE
jgi:hypothetical protein